MVVFWVVTLCKLGSGYLKMVAVCSSETLVPTYKSTQHYNSEDHHWHLHHYENLKYYERKVPMLKYHTLKAYKELEAKLHPFSMSSLDGGEWSARVAFTFQPESLFPQS
jgi:hypothetical protein